MGLNGVFKVYVYYLLYIVVCRITEIQVPTPKSSRKRRYNYTDVENTMLVSRNYFNVICLVVTKTIVRFIDGEKWHKTFASLFDVQGESTIFVNEVDSVFYKHRRWDL